MIELLEGTQGLLSGAFVGWVANEGVGLLRRRADRGRTTRAEHVQLVDDLMTAGLDFARHGGSLAQAVWVQAFQGIDVGERQRGERTDSFNDAGRRVEVVSERVHLRGPRALREHMDDLWRRCQTITADLTTAQKMLLARDHAESAKWAEAVSEQCTALREHMRFLTKVYQDSL